jgi:hypothetical protein
LLCYKKKTWKEEKNTGEREAKAAHIAQQITSKKHKKSGEEK